MIDNIPKSQFLRLRRICSDTSDFMDQCNRYMEYFVNRGYDKKKLIRSAKEISQKSREDILGNPVKRQENERVVFACDWHPTLAQLPGMIKKHHHILQQDQELELIQRTSNGSFPKNENCEKPDHQKRRPTTTRKRWTD